MFSGKVQILSTHPRLSGAVATGMAEQGANEDLARACRTSVSRTIGFVECQAREPPPAGLMGMGRSLAADEETGLDRAAAKDDAEGGESSRSQGPRSLSEYLLVLSHGRWISLGFGLFGLGLTLWRTIPLNLPRRCRSGARSSKDCGSSISVATRPTLSPGLATETCGSLART